MNDRNDEGFNDERSALIDSILDGSVVAPVFIDDLPDAIVDGTFILHEGDMLVLEKWLTINAAPRWLGTSLYRITSIDPFGGGDLKLHDEELEQGAGANYISGPKHGWRFKVGSQGMNLKKRTAKQ